MVTIVGSVKVTLKNFMTAMREQQEAISRGDTKDQKRFLIFSPRDGNVMLYEPNPRSCEVSLGDSGYLFVKDYCPKYDGTYPYKYVGMYNRSGEEVGMDVLDSKEQKMMEIANGLDAIKSDGSLWQVRLVENGEEEDIGEII